MHDARGLETLVFTMQGNCKPTSSATSESEVSPNQAVLDFYRCPKEFLDLRASGELAANSGYFQFGAGTTCYGRSLKGLAQPCITSAQSGTLPGATLDGEHPVLPLNPNEAIENLRLERYPGVQLGRLERVLKSIYYWLRPLTARSIHRYIQKLRATNWQKKQFPRWPVDTTVETICESLLLLSMQAKGIDRIPFIWFWPDGARGCVSMTHDVETSKGQAFCEELIELDDSYGIKAAYQIIPEGRYPVAPEFLNLLRSHECEVCVQDLNHDGRLFDERREFLRRAARINEYGRQFGAKGFRSAILYRKPDWYKDLSFSFDMSIPNVAHLDPQRGGCCTVFPYFIGDILELPLTTTQDYTLFHVLNERSTDLWKKQIEIILAKSGMVSFIVHPDYIIEPDAQAVYRDLLAMLAELRKGENLWFALPGAIDEWWRRRSRMSLVKDGEAWRIVGEGAERAVLAFAKVIEGKLAYELARRPSATSSKQDRLSNAGLPLLAHEE